MLASCSPSPDNINKNKSVKLLSDRTCKAIDLRQQRFAIANKMRFTQDTLSAQKGKGDTVYLHNQLIKYRKQKDSLLKASLALADTIHRQLDSLLPYTDKAAQKRFSITLDSILKAKGCLVKGKEDNLP